MITGHFARRFMHWFGVPFPKNYLSFDTESTGFDTSWDLPLQYGHTLVTDGKVVAKREYILQWTRSPYVDQAWLKDQLKYLENKFREMGKTWHLSYDRVDAEGKPPAAVLRYYLELFKRSRKHKHFIAGQNVWFDCEMFANTSREFLAGDTFEFDEDEVFDIGAIVKTIQLPTPVMPHPLDTLQGWTKRVKGKFAKGVKWNIAATIELLKLNDAEFDANALHGAECDSYWVHRILDELGIRMGSALADVDDEPLPDQPAAERRRDMFNQPVIGSVNEYKA